MKKVLSAVLMLSCAQAAYGLGKVDVKAIDHGAGKLKEVKAVAYVDAPPTKVWKAVTDYANYKLFFPRIAKSKLENRSGNVAYATLHLDLPFPFQGTWYTNRYDENPKNMSMTWKMVNGSIKYTDGGWTLKPQGKGTLATYHVRTDVNIPLIPQALVNQVTKQTIPNIFQGLEKRAKSL